VYTVLIENLTFLTSLNLMCFVYYIHFKVTFVGSVHGKIGNTVLR